ncbi:homoserine kinase [Aestuariibacter salexigens]|uniref:homoserine kinase n=1 Tax=Aestuariibacter salexigens TaxID=226010 RepID=UPI0003FF2FD5|nr:homoserine kinase [Aestuariibacter salexigens]
MNVTAYAPASIGNVSLGFDILGAALEPVSGDALGDTVSAREAECFSLTVSGPFASKLPGNVDDNIVRHCYDYFINALRDKGVSARPCALHLSKNLPIGSGLGSSASSIVAAFVALNHFYATPFDDNTLLTMMGALEGQISGSVHYDNVAPCFLGGLSLMTGQSSPVAVSLPVIKQWYWVVCYSGISVSTSAAREILPTQYNIQDTLAFGRQLAVFVDALHRGDASQAAAMMNDVIAEPHRKALLPYFDESRVYCMQQGALSFGISGSGPTVFAVTDNQHSAETMLTWLKQHYIQNDHGFGHVCRLREQGASVQNNE